MISPTQYIYNFNGIVRLRTTDFGCILAMCLSLLLQCLGANKKVSEQETDDPNASIYPIVVDTDRRPSSLGSIVKSPIPNSCGDKTSTGDGKDGNDGNVRDEPSNGTTGDEDGVLYTPFGKCYHHHRGCKFLKDSKSIKSNPKKSVPSELRPCNSCSPRKVTNENAPYFKTHSGKKYHVRAECYGLRKSGNIIGVFETPQLEPCEICVLKNKFKDKN